jgi:hypothetical protein
VDKFIPISKVQPGYEMLHDGQLHLVEKVDDGNPVYTTIELPATIVQRPFDYLVGVRCTPKPRSRPACPPLTARLTPEDRAWTEWFAEQSGMAPQELLAVALRMYHAQIDKLQVQAMAETLRSLPAPRAPRKPHRWWWGKRKRAA